MKYIELETSVPLPAFSPAPDTWNKLPTTPLSSFHTLSPYIGKLKPQIARDLVLAYSRPDDLVVDPFCGSGGIPLEASLNGRQVIASDVSPYACLLTQAKLSPPSSIDSALEDLQEVYERSRERCNVNLSTVPSWVRQFFDPQTLEESIKFADECTEQHKSFLLACLLGILHHQRPGFLSYPSSHLVPYLRDKKFPRQLFPEMYTYRDLLPRMVAKIKRVYKTSPVISNATTSKIHCTDITELKLPRSGVDTIITSPPYMNALDYRRDNRLRIWFLDRDTKNYSPEPTDKKVGLELMVSQLVRQATYSLRKGGKLVLVVGEMVVRKRLSSHPSASYSMALEDTGRFELVSAIRDQIPDVRRSRRDYSGTKAEHILVYEKT